jgi:hypothetical protein
LKLCSRFGASRSYQGFTPDKRRQLSWPSASSRLCSRHHPGLPLPLMRFSRLYRVLLRCRMALPVRETPSFLKFLPFSSALPMWTRGTPRLLIPCGYDQIVTDPTDYPLRYSHSEPDRSLEVQAFAQRYLFTWCNPHSKTPLGLPQTGICQLSPDNNSPGSQYFKSPLATSPGYRLLPCHIINSKNYSSNL